MRGAIKQTVLRRLSAHYVTAFIVLLAVRAYAQSSQFLFDRNGNLLVQTATIATPPLILGQPQNRIVAPGDSASFSVVAADTRLLNYQWRFNGANIGGATGDALLLQSVSAGNQGEYRVILTNPSGSVTSAPAFLMIDSDADGMGDSWETAHFTGLSQVAAGDADGDGASNLQEFQDGSDPTDPNSVRFRLLVIRDGGSVIKTLDQATYTNSEPVTLTAMASPGQEPFHAWMGDILTRSNPVTLVMTNNKTVIARFTPIAFTWTNLAGGDWNVAANWTPNLVPGSNDIVVIPSGTITLNTPANCAEITLNAGTLTGSGVLTVWENFAWIGGAMSGSGRTILETNATLEIKTAFVSLNARTVENAGTIQLSGGGSLDVTGGATVTNRPGALFDVQNAATIGSVFANGRLDNAGTFRKSGSSGTATFGSGMGFNNTGTVDIQTGTLSLAGGGTNSGTFTTPDTTAVEWTGGTFTLNPGGQLSGDGLYRINAGTVTANTNLAIEKLDLITGTLGGTGAVTINSLMNWSGGTMSGGGRTIIPVGATLNAAAPSSAGLNARTLDNRGTVLWTGAGNIGFVSSVITNGAGALFHAQGAGGLAFVSGPNRFDNAGTFRKSVNNGTLNILDFSSSGSFKNLGTVEIQTGTLLCDASFTNAGVIQLSGATTNRIARGGSATGTFTTPASALVEWTGGTFTLSPGAQLNGAGLYKLNGGTVTVDANLTIANLDLVSGSSILNGSGAVTIGSTMNWTTGTMSGGGRTIIPSGATLQVGSASGTGLQRVLDNGGTVLWTGAGTLGLLNGVITNRAGALFHAQNAAQFFFAGGASRFDNAGTFRKSFSTGTTTIGVTFTNHGTVEIQTGTLLFSGSFNNHNIVNLSAGTTNRLVGGSATGTFDTPATALVEWTGGTFTLNPGAQLNGAGLYKLNGGTVTANANLTVTNLDLVHGSSTLGGTGTVAIVGAMNWMDGAMDGSGRTIIPAGATLQIGNSSGMGLQRTLENGGSVLWTGAGGIVLLNGVITNRAGGLFDAQNAAQFFFAGGASRFDNAGTFRKSVSTGSTTIGVNFTNYATVDLRSGILAANGGYTSSSNSLLNCALGGTTPGTGYGQLQVAGTVTLNGGLSVNLLPGFTPATNDTFTVLTAGTRSGTFAIFYFPSNDVTMQMSNTANSVVVQVTAVADPKPVLLQPEIIGPDIKLTWTAISNRTYRLESNPDLNPSNWFVLPGDVISFSNTASKLDPLTPSNRLYRVRVVP